MISDFRKQLPTRIQKAFLGVGDQTVAKYVGAIDEVVKNDSLSFWLNLIKLAFGLRTSAQDVNSFVDAFVNEDPDFPRADNQNLLRLLACYSIANFVSQSSSNIAGRLALSIRTTLFLDQYNVSDVPFVAANAKLRLILDSLSIRRDQLADSETNLVEMEEKCDEEQADETTSFTNGETVKLLAAVRSTITSIKALKEELNVHWWLFGEFMQVVDESFGNIPVKRMVVLSAFELSNQTAFKLPLRNSEQFLRKALSTCKSKKKIDQASLQEIVSELTDEDKNIVLEKIRDKVDYQTPLLLAIKCSQDSVDQDWIPQFKALSNQGDASKEFSLALIADQLYNELVLLKMG